MAYNPYPGGLVDSFPSYQNSLWSNDAALNSSYNRIGGAGASRGTPYAAAFGKFNQENSNDLLRQFAPFLNGGGYPGASPAITTSQPAVIYGGEGYSPTAGKGAGPGNMQFPSGGSGSPAQNPPPGYDPQYDKAMSAATKASSLRGVGDYTDAAAYMNPDEAARMKSGLGPNQSSPTEMLTGRPAMGAATPLAPPAGVSMTPYSGSGGAGSGAAAYASESNPLGGPMTRPGMLTTNINPYPKGSQQWYDYETKNKQAENQYSRTMGSVGAAPGMGR